MAAVDYFLKIDGIPGESQDDKHKNEIEVMSFHLGVDNVGTSASAGGGGAGRVRFEDFMITKHVDKASPKLLEACSGGKHISSAVLTCRKQGGNQEEYLKITLSEVLVSGYNTSGAPIGRRMHTETVTGATAAAAQTVPVPTEQITINFGKIEYEYREQESKGGTKGPVKMVWNLKANKAG